MVAAACESETESGGTCCRCVTCKHHSTHFLLSQCPSLLNLITHALDIHKYNTFSSLSPDLSQRIFNNLVYSSYLTPASLQPFRDSALQDSYLGEYANAYGGGGAAAAIVVDAWMDVISSQGSSLLKLLLQ
ncbi:hypothetical protein AAZX31_15G005900 [Glycine max]|uniref:Uncharacterized protein n=1 Tax=Glycine max TaxID=3847 RepID=K7M8S3_SOYBN|nr:uncharacterized protein LOC102660607 isoform X2 [Glycine max]KAH1144847.1 hypothetical protein GYH30_040936 [Glycine max]KAH1144849.1 hypothetical protein GYH30_040936 [Glycine max]KRH09701.1 hypothetical protein GLYMA_15G006200v4 [Glycine max]|eukprot:XP_006597112.1 uncharacterized protein LOC102660607 isoform X2 [Glycine max]